MKFSNLKNLIVSDLKKTKFLNTSLTVNKIVLLLQSEWLCSLAKAMRILRNPKIYDCHS